VTLVRELEIVDAMLEHALAASDGSMLPVGIGITRAQVEASLANLRDEHRATERLERRPDAPTEYAPLARFVEQLELDPIDRHVLVLAAAPGASSRI
jgi:hypothetical protein